MAVGSSVDPTGASVARSARSYPKPSKNGIDQYYGLPYQDHNYGAPPPTSPPMSPNPDGTELAIEASACDGSNQFLNSTELNNGKVPIDSTEHNKPSRNIEELSSDTFRNSEVSNDSADLTRCICGFIHDDGYMICCDRCYVWQHIDCMQIDRNCIPESYLCDQCNPRILDHERAMHLQRQKQQDFLADLHSMLSDNDECITVGKNTHNKDIRGKKRKRSVDEIRNNKNNDGSKRSRQRSKSFVFNNNDYGHVDDLWKMKMKEWVKSYQEAGEQNKYSKSMHQVVSTSNKNNNAHSSDSILVQLQAQLAKVRRLRNTILAMEDIAVGQPIVEYQGSFMLMKEFDVSIDRVYQIPHPFVLFYNGYDGLDICVDSRTYGNKARFLRRSCSPNAEIRHVIGKEDFCLFVFSSKPIKKESEITIPFDINYENCSYPLPCACLSKDCPVYKSNMSKAHSKLDFKIMPNNRDASPFLNYLNHQQINGYSSTEENIAYDNEESAADNHRKKSREERKMEAYIRAFEKLEKKEKRKEFLQQQSLGKNLSSSTANNADTSTQFTTQSTSLPVSTNKEESTAISTLTQDISTEVVSSTSLTTSLLVAQKRTSRRHSGRGRRSSKKLSSDDSLSYMRNNNIRVKSATEFQSELLSSFSEDSCDTLGSEISHDTSSELNRISSSTSPSLSTTFPSLSCFQVSDSPTFSSKQIVEVMQDLPAFINMTDSSAGGDSDGAKIMNDVNSRTSYSVVENCEEYSCLPPDDQVITMVRDCRRSSSLTEWSDSDSKVTISLSSVRPSSASSCCLSREDRTSASSPSVRMPKVPLSVSTAPVYPIVSCNVVPWHFQPGVPCGLVPIKIVSNMKVLRYSPTKDIKKWWLKRAVNDCLNLASITKLDDQSEKENVEVLDNADQLSSPQNDFDRITFWKKQLLGKNLDVPEVTEQAPEKPGEGDATVTIIKEDVSAVQEIVNSNCTDDENAVSCQDREEEIVSVADCDVSVCSSEHAVPDNEAEQDTSSSDEKSNRSSEVFNEGSTKESFLETLSDDTSDGMHAGTKLDLKLSDDSDSRQGLWMFPNMHQAPIKRKVSLQEYLKRSKETKKISSSTSQNVLSVLSSTKCPTKNKLVKTKSKNCPETKTKKTNEKAEESPTVEPPRSDFFKSTKFSEALSRLSNNEEVLGLVNQVVKHLKSTGIEATATPKSESEPVVTTPAPAKIVEKTSSAPKLAAHSPPHASPVASTKNQDQSTISSMATSPLPVKTLTTQHRDEQRPALSDARNRHPPRQELKFHEPGTHRRQIYVRRRTDDDRRQFDRSLSRSSSPSPHSNSRTLPESPSQIYPLHSCDSRSPNYGRISPRIVSPSSPPPMHRWQQYPAHNGCGDSREPLDKHLGNSSPYSKDYHPPYYEADYSGGRKEYYKHPEHTRAPPFHHHHPRHFNDRNYEDIRPSPPPPPMFTRHDSGSSYVNDSRLPPHHHSGSDYSRTYSGPRPYKPSSPSSPYRRYTSPLPYQSEANYPPSRCSGGYRN